MMPGTIVVHKIDKKLKYAQANMHYVSSKYVEYKHTRHIFKWLYYFIKYKRLKRIIGKYNYIKLKWW